MIKEIVKTFFMVSFDCLISLLLLIYFLFFCILFIKVD